MTPDVLLEEVKQIQHDYLRVLKSLRVNKDSDIIPLANEILVFWFRKRKIIDFFLEFLSRDKRHFIYTGAAYVNINQKDHFPFLLLPGNHIWDDPLPSYINSFKNIIKGQLNNEIRSAFWKLVANNIKIISSLQKHILVIPVRFIFELENKQKITDISDRLFLDLFKPELEISDIKTYFSKFKTIYDIKRGIKSSLIKNVLPSDPSCTFIESFDKNKELVPEFSNQLDDSANFFTIVNGGFSQSSSILLVCATYGLKPYIHFSPAMHYLLWLYPIYNKALHLEEIVFWAIVGFSVSRNFDSSRFKSFTTKRFIDYLDDKQFATKLTEKINIDKLDPDYLQFKSIEKSVIKVLDSIYPKTQVNETN